MSADGVRRALDPRRGISEIVIIRRQTGVDPDRVSYDVPCRAVVNTGAATVLIAGIEQTADEIRMLDDELKRARFPGQYPRHGDLVIYDDGRTGIVQGHANVSPLGRDNYIILTVKGVI